MSQQLDTLLCSCVPVFATTKPFSKPPRGSKRCARAPAAQNSFLPVAGVTGSYYLAWMVLLQFWSFRKRSWPAEEKSCEVFQWRVLGKQLVSLLGKTHLKTSGIMARAAVIIFCVKLLKSLLAAVEFSPLYTFWLHFHLIKMEICSALIVSFRLFLFFTSNYIYMSWGDLERLFQ